jgi:PKD repeat protein
VSEGRSGRAGTGAGQPQTFPRARLAALALCAALVAVAAGAGGARAVVVEINGHGYGVAPRGDIRSSSIPGANRTLHAGARSRARPYDEPPNGGSPLEWLGGPVMQSSITHVIYWDPEKEFTAEAKAIIKAFFTDVAHDSGLASNVFGVDAQYTEGEEGPNAAYDSTYAGEIEDTNPYPKTGNCTTPKGEFADNATTYSTCLLDQQLQSQLKSFIAEQELNRGSSQLYFLLLPHKVVTCVNEIDPQVNELACSNNVFCAYHSYIEPGSNEIIYAAVPFSLLDSVNAKSCQDDDKSELQAPNGDTTGTNSTTRYADVATKYISHEFSEAITDPLPEHETAWVDQLGLETGDKCNATPFEGVEEIEGKEFEEEGEPGFDRNAFLPTLGTATNGSLYDQEINGGQFYLQSEWDNVVEECLMKPLEIERAEFTPASGSIAPGTPVTFEASAEDPYEHAIFKWQFGDGETGSGPEPTHTYAGDGEEKVKLTVEDSLTNSKTEVSHTLIVAGPTVVTLAPGAIEEEAAELKGSVNPNGEAVTSCEFEWDTTTAYRKTAECNAEPASGTSPEAVSAEIEELEPNTTYHYRLVAKTAGGTTQGSDERFTTLPEEPEAEATEATGIGQSYATLNATVDPEGAGIETCEFKYFSVSKPEERSVECELGPAVNGLVPVSAKVSGLSAEAEYEFIVFATTRGGEAESAELFETLPPAAPEVALGAPSSVGQSFATLVGSVNPQGAEISGCVFEYGTSSSYGAAAPCSPTPPRGDEPVAVSAALSGLSAGTTYHYRLVERYGEGQQALSADATLTTDPIVVTEPEANQPPPTLPGSLPPPPTPDSSFTLAAPTMNGTTGAITFTFSVHNPGTATWMLTFRNGRFGVFSAGAGRCKAGFVRLQRRCRPLKIVFAHGRKTAVAAGTVSFTARPSAPARKALKNALKRHKGLAVSVEVRFQSSLGGTAVVRRRTITIKRKRNKR